MVENGFLHTVSETLYNFLLPASQKINTSLQGFQLLHHKTSACSFILPTPNHQNCLEFIATFWFLYEAFSVQSLLRRMPAPRLKPRHNLLLMASEIRRKPTGWTYKIPINDGKDYLTQLVLARFPSTVSLFTMARNYIPEINLIIERDNEIICRTLSNISTSISAHGPAAHTQNNENPWSKKFTYLCELYIYVM